MGKHGPCRHCGVTTTPLWRNGPSNKPVLCNACGSRWRTKGSLTNYTPLHAREPINPEELKVSRVKSVSFKPKVRKLNKLKIKKSCGAAENENEMPYSDQNLRKILEVDTSNQSSTGSATLYSESCAQFGTTEASDLTGSAQSNVRESQVPSKKRMTRTDLEPSPVEKLRQDLYTIMQEQQSSCLSSLSEDLLYESKTPVGSVELGNASILLRYPNQKVVEEESDASSRPIDNKSCIINEAYSGSASFTVHGESKGTKLSTAGIDKLKKCTAQWAQELIKRDKSYMDKLQILQDRDSPLGFINLKDVVNFEVLIRHMTDEEQQQLMKYLTSIDNSKYSESLRTTLNSSQFKENLSYFQQLLQEGIFDSSILGMDAGEYRTLKRRVLRNSMTSTWVQHYKLLKDVKNKLNTVGREGETAFNYLGRSKFTLPKRPRELHNLHVPELDIDIEFLVMFGLTNAIAAFMDMMNRVFKSYLYQFVVFIDILIYSKNLAEHKEHMRIILQTLKENKFYAILKKCEFWLDSVAFLGHTISKDGVSVDAKKIKVVVDWKNPSYPTEIQSFLGMASYFRKADRHNEKSKKASKSKSSVSSTNPQSILIYDAEEFVDNDGICFSPRTIFASPPEHSSMLPSLQFTDDSTNHDLLLDAPCNNSSFPEAELVGRSNSYAESGVFDDGEESRSGFPASSFNGQKTRHC